MVQTQNCSDPPNPRRAPARRKTRAPAQTAVTGDSWGNMPKGRLVLASSIDWQRLAVCGGLELKNVAAVVKTVLVDPMLVGR